MVQMLEKFGLVTEPVETGVLRVPRPVESSVGVGSDVLVAFLEQEVGKCLVCTATDVKAGSSKP